MNRFLVSVVLPVFNERENLAPLLHEITTALRSTPHEIVAIDDGSTDGSLDEMKRLKAVFPTLQAWALGQNLGQSAAFAAGFDQARGDVVVTMDADGQNDPRDVPRLLDALQRTDGAAAVVGFRSRRADSWWKRAQSRVANAVRNTVTGDRILDTGCSLKAMRRDALVGLPRFDGMHRFLPTLIRMAGGMVLEIPVSHRPRLHGESKYGMWNRAFRGLRDALGVRWLGKRALGRAHTKEVE